MFLNNIFFYDLTPRNLVEVFRLFEKPLLEKQIHPKCRI